MYTYYIYDIYHVPMHVWKLKNADFLEMSHYRLGNGGRKWRK